MSERPEVVVVGLGPAGPDLLTAETTRAIDASTNRFVRTFRHPAASAVPGALSFDRHYEAAEDIEGVYAAIVEDLVSEARRGGRVLYAVPGSPAVAERSVELLRADPRVTCVVLPALSCLDLAWVRLGVDPLAIGARVVDGHRFETEAAGERGPLLVLQCDQPTVCATIKLALDDGPTVTVLHHLGLPDERIWDVSWLELDRLRPDHLTSLWIPQLAAPVGQELVRLHELVRILRQRCPWDRAQTHASLRRHLLEESYEVLEAIDSGDSEHLEEELGDLLFQVYLHAALATEEGEFTLADVARGIHDKLVGRHPHVFGAGEATTAGEAELSWEVRKRQEKLRGSLMDGIPAALPALLHAQKVQGKAAAVGFDWEDAEGAWPKVDEEIAETRQAVATGGDVEDEIGDLLFACVNVARHLGVDAEGALRRATAKFGDRFRAVETLAADRGISLAGAGLPVLDAMWDEVKAGVPPGA